MRRTWDRLESGSVQDLLRLLHYALLDSSRALAAFLVDKVSYQTDLHATGS